MGRAVVPAGINPPDFDFPILEHPKVTVGNRPAAITTRANKYDPFEDPVEGDREAGPLLNLYQQGVNVVWIGFFWVMHSEAVHVHMDDLVAQILSGFLSKQYCFPEALNSDRSGIFRVNRKNITATNSQTEYERAMQELGIEVLYASSPEAKGRAERANQTLQDRLVKEMRLEGICNYEKANEFLQGYLEKHNHRFAVQPFSSIDCHEPL